MLTQACQVEAQHTVDLPVALPLSLAACRLLLLRATLQCGHQEHDLCQGDARRDCLARASGANLVAIESEAEHDALATELANFSDGVSSWIGLESVNRVQSKNPSDFVWLITGQTPAVSYWAENEPNNFNR